ncbi:uncharacterized protein LOC121369015 isoform X2 [Gigantopelta aegis]|uniref:uncharacterized protein LOC121369015 isoform X2 n=1 Tax=Gigantopelta aegis TaxID=1735272 RepID=UPI001B88B171|nr:uncharacterized protein LOC121369015 isoform X2 [Gigantopelta aegis]
MVIPSLEDTELNTLFSVHKTTTELHQEKIGKNNMFLNGLGMNVSPRLQESKLQKEESVTSKIPVKILTLWWKMFSRIFNSENAVQILNRRIRESDISVSQLSSENHNIFKDSHLEVLTSNSNDITVEKTNFKSSQTRDRRDTFANPSKKNISEHHLKSDFGNKSSTAVNTTFFRDLIRKVTLEAEVKHSAQIAFLCLTGLCCLMTWTVWYNGMCRNRTLKYMYWDRQKTVTTDIRDILYRRGKYLPMFQDEQYDVVYVKDKGTDP